MFKAILRKLGFSRELFLQDIATYSKGQKKKVMLAGCLSQEAHLYILDEPLNYLDIFSRIQIQDLLLEFQPTVLFVEHDRYFCDQIKTKIVEI
ncbi:ATP-binding cassette domain-containing protein [Thomasclavelia cocleata]|uniref:ATP-binding cassette domain-containing protein n=1 Tax=Thomasclavelia cocleata TaxID=69824 RepID=UPI0025AC44D1|nr:ATP-binding cassette domain-containing protein [Thomasclavelia cocleata]